MRTVKNCQRGKGQLWDLHPCRFSKLNWNKALSSSKGGSVLGNRVYTRLPPEVSSNLHFSCSRSQFKGLTLAQVSAFHRENVVHCWQRTAFLPLHSFKRPAAGLEICQKNKKLSKQILPTQIKTKERKIDFFLELGETLFLCGWRPWWICSRLFANILYFLGEKGSWFTWYVGWHNFDAGKEQLQQF